MDRGAAVLVTACIGGMLAAQAPINARLGQSVGQLQAALVSFAIGTLALAVIVAFIGGGYVRFGRLGEVPALYFIGGLLGAAYVTTALSLIGTLGAGGITAATISGQLILSLIIDRFGLFGVPQQPITLSRLVAIVLLAVGVVLMVRR